MRELVALLFGRSDRPIDRGTYLQVGLALMALKYLVDAALVCLVMALPVASPIAMLGSIVSHVLAQRGRPTSLSHISMLFCLLFVGTAIDAAMPAPGARIVTTAIEIDAPAEVVWQHVTSFGDITAPPRWLFRTGLAYPIRARLEGTGVGAVRHCEFTTGAFVEPITGWDAPRRLAFDVIAQPPPLQEWSPYSRVFAPHLDGFFRTSKGEFRLVPLDNGRTRLEGRTWYNLDMQPAIYWTTLADNILHAIHDRVLEHIKTRAQEHDQAHAGDSRLPRASTGDQVPLDALGRRLSPGEYSGSASCPVVQRDQALKAMCLFIS